MLNRLLLLAAILAPLPVASALASETPSAKTHCRGMLPRSLQQQLTARFAGLKVVELSDLAADQRESWVKVHGDACPGVTSGNFDGSKRDQFAILLWRKASPARQALVFVRRDKDREYSVRLIDDRKGASPEPPMAVYRALAGTYRDFYDRETAIQVKTDLIVLEGSIAAQAYYLVGGEIGRIILSD